MPNKYLMHKQMRKDMDMRMNDHRRDYNQGDYGRDGDNYSGDHRNPYGSKGGYVDSYGSKDYAMDYNQYDSRGYDRAYDNRRGDRNSGNDGYGYHFHGNPRNAQPSAYEMYAQVTPQMYDNRGYDKGYDQNYDQRRYDRAYDRGYDRDSGEEQSEKKFKEEIKKLPQELKQYDKFGLRKEEIINKASQMGIQYDKYSEDEFLATYYLMMCEFPVDILNTPQAYMVMAKHFLEGKKGKYKGADKLACYYYEIFQEE